MFFNRPRPCAVAFAGCCFLLASAANPQAGKLFSHFQRISEKPILSPTGAGWESAGTFNPAVLARDNKFVMLFRAQDAKGTSRLGYAESTDGVHFTPKYGPVLVPKEDYEKDGGVEDPRLVQL